MKHIQRFRRWVPLAAMLLLSGWLLFSVVSDGSTIFTRRTADSPTQTPAQLRGEQQPKAAEYTPDELLNETNKRRAEKGVNPLSPDPVLNDTAQRKCEDMAARDDYEHGELAPYFDPLDRSLYSENIVYGYDSAGRVIDAFVGSPSHYAAMMDTKYTRVGFGICPFRGSKLVVQHFSNEPTSSSAVNGTATQSRLSPYTYMGGSYSSMPDGHVDFEMPDYNQPRQTPTYVPPAPTTSSGTNYGSTGGCDSSAAQYLPQCN